MIIGAFDTEHSKDIFRPWEKGFYLSCIGIADTTGTKKLLWFDHHAVEPDHRRALDEFQSWLDSVDIVAAHNIKHDMVIMRYMGIDFEKVNLWCTQVAEYLLSGQDVINRLYDLSNVAQHYDFPPKLDVVRTQYWDCGIDTYDVPMDVLGTYCLDDTQKVLDVMRKQQYYAKQAGKWQLVKLHNEFTKSLADMELSGFKWDMERSVEIYNEYIRKVEKIEQDLYQIAGDRRINFGSNQQLAAFLYGGQCKVSWKEWVTKEIKKDKATRYYEKKFEECINLQRIFSPPRRSKKDADKLPKTDKGTISELKCRTKRQTLVKELLIKRSKRQKVAETLIGKRTSSGLNRKVQPDGCIHPKFNQTVAITGRLSSSDPNGQNFPRGSTSPIKKCIKPKRDWHCQYDLKQVEWKGAGELSGCPVMIAEINSGIDQHNKSCTDLMELELTKENRQDAKIFNFRMIYGGTAYGFHLDPKMPRFGVGKWMQIVSDFEQKYYGLSAWQQANINAVMRGQPIQLFSGRTFTFGKSVFKDGIWQYSDTEIKNYPVQGVAGGDILPLVCCIIRRGMKSRQLQSHLFITVHDSLGFDAITEEVPILHAICTEVGGNLHKYIKAYFGYECRVTNWGGDFEVGPDYGTLMKYEEWKEQYYDTARA